MSQDVEELTIGLEGQVFVAPFGTTLPTEFDSVLNAAFFEVGLTSDAGATFKEGRNLKRHMSWQRMRPTRISVTSKTTTAQTQLQQWNGENFGLVFGGGDLTEVSSGSYRFDPPLASELNFYSFILQFADKGFTYRLVGERGFLGDDVEFKLTRDDLALLPLALEVLDTSDEGSGWFMLSDDPAFAPVS